MWLNTVEAKQQIDAVGNDIFSELSRKHQLACASAVRLLKRGGFLIYGKYPILVWRSLPPIEANEFFHALSIPVCDDKTVYDDLALYFGDPITNVLQVCNEK
jgi:hypothetical protein